MNAVGCTIKYRFKGSDFFMSVVIERLNTRSWKIGNHPSQRRTTCDEFDFCDFDDCPRFVVVGVECAVVDAVRS